MSDPDVILASASPARRDVLTGAGVPFSIDPATIDEAAMKSAMAQEGASAQEVAVGLAHMKALRVSRRHGEAMVIGADQILEVEGRWFDKPADLDEARQTLLALRGRVHALATAACICRGGTRIWHYVETPKLTMRTFSDDCLEWYLKHSGDDILSSVGAYRLEGTGIQLFDRIEGSYFTILGLPLLALLDFLRANGVVRS